MTSAAARNNPLGGRPVAFLLSQSRIAVSESENAVLDYFPARRPEDGTLEFSIDPVFLAAVGVDNGFQREFRNSALFATTLSGGDTGVQ